MTPGVGERWRWRTGDDDDDGCVTTAEYSGCSVSRRLEEPVYYGGRRRQHPTSHPKAKRATSDTTVNWSDLPASDLTSGVWSPVSSPPSCVTNGAISTISNGSKITYQFYGTTITVNVVQFPSGAPYIVTLDGKSTGLNSFSATNSCTAAFSQNDLQKQSHTIIIQHNGTGGLAGLGKSTLMFQSLVYTPFDPSEISNVDVPAIVGGVLGGVAFLLVVAFAYWLWKRRKPMGDMATEPSATDHHYQGLNSTQRSSDSRNAHITPYIVLPSDTDHSFSRKPELNSGTSNPSASTDSGNPRLKLSSNSRGVSTESGQGATGSGSGSGPGGASGSQTRAARLRNAAVTSTPPVSRMAAQPPPAQANLLAPSARRASNWASAEDDFSPEGRDHRSSYSLSDLSRPAGQQMPPPPSYDTINRSPPRSPPLSNLSANTTHTASSSRRLLPDTGSGTQGQGQLSAADVDTIAHRVVELMQTPRGAQAPPQPGQYHPDVKQAVEDILAHQEKKG